MPTVPSTFQDSSVGVVLPGVADQITALDIPNSPTPDPDLDDLVLLPVVTGDPLGAITSVSNDRTPAHLTREPKPRLSLSDLTLHSPSSGILGTPFDISEPRFEYPFPESTPDPVVYGPSFPAFSTHIPVFASSSQLPPVSTSWGKLDSSKMFSPTHPKLQARDPPVPPGLVNKKRWSMNANVPPPQAPTRARSPTMRAKEERGTSRPGSEERKAGLVGRSTASTRVVAARPASPFGKSTVSSEDERTPTLPSIHGASQPSISPPSAETSGAAVEIR
ncbi:hypothetical protein BXZ70DRAFT_126442 [Cristinia sonorae]|uniref:Uncharacterized protein n=1 Tax=Cristinia sonorae TaxID=1940300 RepID=A0A8K0UPR1_9AGAR|nr:hypothetical protein BXZ70DRAFT_126442 [Cristinia sonorae]